MRREVNDIMGLAAMDPGGYENTMPRHAQTPDKLAKSFPSLFRLKSAHNNTLECLAMMAPVFWAAQTLKLDELVFAKLSVLFLLARTAYVLCCKQMLSRLINNNGSPTPCAVRRLATPRRAHHPRITSRIHLMHPPFV